MRAWARRLFWTGLLIAVFIAGSDAVGFLRGVRASYPQWAPLSLAERRRLLHEDGFMDLLEATGRAFPEPRTVVIWVREVRRDALPELVRLGERWMKTAYYLYPHLVLPLASEWILPRFATLGLIDPALPPQLEARYLPLAAVTKPLAILAFRPRLPDRLESLLIDQTDVTPSEVIDVRGRLRAALELPVAEAWLSSLDLQIEGWTSGETIRVALRAAAAPGAALGEVTRPGPTPETPERFVFTPPVRTAPGEGLSIEISHLGGGDGAIRLRGRPGRPWLRVFAVEPAARPLVREPLGTLFAVPGAP